MKLVYDIHDKPPFGKLLVLATQQLLAILAATIAVPTIIGLPAQIPAAILGAGIGTMVYLLFTRFKSPVFLAARSRSSIRSSARRRSGIWASSSAGFSQASYMSS